MLGPAIFLVSAFFGFLCYRFFHILTFQLHKASEFFAKRYNNLKKWKKITFSCAVLFSICLFLAVLYGVYHTIVNSPVILVHFILGVLFGFMLSKMLEYADQPRIHLQWGVASLVVFAVGILIGDIIPLSQHLKKLSTPWGSLEFNKSKIIDESPQIQDAGSKSRRTNVPETYFRTGVNGLNRLQSIIQRDFETYKIIRTADKAIFHFVASRGNLESYKNAYHMKFELKKILNFKAEILWPTANCLEIYSKIFPTGLPLHQILSELSSEILKFRSQNKSRDSGNLINNEYDESSVAEYRRNLNTLIGKVMKHIHDALSNVDLDKGDDIEKCTERDFANPLEEFIKTNEEKIPYRAILASNVMITAGQPLAGANVIARWVDQSNTHPGSKSELDLIFQIRALTELNIILETTENYRELIEVIWRINVILEKLLAKVLANNYGTISLDSCSSIENAIGNGSEFEYIKRYLFSSLIFKARAVLFQSKYLGSNAEVMDLAEDIYKSDLNCFASLFYFNKSMLFNYRTEILIAYAHAHMSHSQQIKILSQDDRSSRHDHLRKVRVALQEATDLDKKYRDLISNQTISIFESSFAEIVSKKYIDETREIKIDTLLYETEQLINQN